MWTGHEANPWAEAVAGNRIGAVGTDALVASLQGSDTRVIELNGRFISPGFIDNHTHFNRAGELLLGINLLEVSDEEGLIREVREAANRLPDGAWMTGGGWGAYEQWAVSSTGRGDDVQRPETLFRPDRTAIDPVSPGNPALLWNWDRTRYLANGAALEAAGADCSWEGVECENGVATGCIDAETAARIRSPGTPGEGPGLSCAGVPSPLLTAPASGLGRINGIHTGLCTFLHNSQLIWTFGVFTMLTMSTQREVILSEACDLLTSGGLEALTMRKLAERLGVTAPALYRHYESKEMVLVDVVGEAFKVFAQYLYRALEGRTPMERFSLTGRSYLAFALEHPRYYQLLHMGKDALPDEAATHACGTGQFMVDRVREGMESGMLKAGSPETVARTIWAHAHGLVSIYLRGLLRIGEHEFRQLFLESSWRLMEGLAEPEFAAAMGEDIRASLTAEGSRVEEIAT